MNQVDDEYRGFEWIDFRDSEASIISFLRYRAESRRIPRLRLQFHAGSAP